MGQATSQEEVTRQETSMVTPDGLRQELKFAALKERTDVSALLGRLAERYVKVRGGGRR